MQAMQFPICTDAVACPGTQAPRHNLGTISDFRLVAHIASGLVSVTNEFYLGNFSPSTSQSSMQPSCPDSSTFLRQPAWLAVTSLILPFDMLGFRGDAFAVICLGLPLFLCVRIRRAS